MEGAPLNLAAGDVSASDFPMASATAVIADDISPLAMAATSFPETPLEGVKKPDELDFKPEVKDDNANIASPKVEVAEDQDVEEDQDTMVRNKTTVQDQDVEEEDNALHLSTYFVSLENRLPAVALDLVYWRQPQFTAGVFLFLFCLLVAFSWYSCISVVSYLALLALCVTISFVTFKRVSAAVQKTGDDHPFQEYLDVDMESFFAVDDVNDAVQAGIRHLFHLADVLRRLFLIANLFDSLKFGALLYALTYVGEMFNLLTIFIIVLVILFAVPKTYELYGDELDAVAAKLAAQAKAQWPVIQEQVVDRLMVIKKKAIAALPIGKDKEA